MGLFGRKKEKLPEGIRLVYYDGDLPGFRNGIGCWFLLTDDTLYIRKVNPYVEIKLERSRLLSIEDYKERAYMMRFKGNDGTFSTTGDVQFFVVNYIGKDGAKKHIDFWGAGFETSKMFKLMIRLLKSQKNQPDQSYEI